MKPKGRVLHFSSTNTPQPQARPPRKRKSRVTPVNVWAGVLKTAKIAATCSGLSFSAFLHYTLIKAIYTVQNERRLPVYIGDLEPQGIAKLGKVSRLAYEAIHKQGLSPYN